MEKQQKKYDVVALGELLIDFTQSGSSEQGNGLFEACPGGAPCNVLAMLSKLGKKTSFIGKVGQDPFGLLLKSTLEEVKIDTTGLKFDEKVPTTLALVHTLADGDRDFSFYRNPGADMMLTEGDVDTDLIKQTKIFHFGTLSMTHDNIKKATQKAITEAKKEGVLLSFDPNLRPSLWDSLGHAKEAMEYGCSVCDILKISDNEIQFISGKEDYEEGIAYLLDKYQISLILLTLGKDGSRAYYKGMRVEVNGFLCNAIETTGAGDTFCGCVLNYVIDHGIHGLTKVELEQMLAFANGAAALITTRKGALKAMPERAEVEAILYEQGNKNVS
ncbi:MAG: carbohydrate kinase [Lachnospiraceae bacterium]|nr:carbohydrate kinase [Lachnospiraceae bacterium]